MKLSHLNEQGDARMVSIDEKKATKRVALAKGKIYLSPELLNLITNHKVPKGDVLSVGRIAGIMAAKETSHLIPMCHPLLIEGSSVTFEIIKDKGYVEATCEVKVSGKTGVEMEALTGVTVALLVIYDMCKAVDKNMLIGDVRLIKKTGGKSGVYEREE
ncbi:cyclic pyranopterin monophosphate synthase accessory protein [endosymbiont 'TC1' of Trimyema compressum]|uniref:cyclic pyranopterin monophosphate synthase MoaC n=1 Tax=endosymbiont 'TC1' of Trimyema compressum TaxID=243899 RepID=UPI0007F0603C|nr:cyclic pyranopterin monophosphate synthase MoaC [endosymbiont 'TC1' of Trimyema compressum]AMP20107.1 cyclic pyranopterin monophosphate synthase accessory protein [endosymbiont 'TC1' of Trimyema compressum]